MAFELFHIEETVKSQNTVAAELAQRVLMLLSSGLCVSASFPPFPDVGAPPCSPATASPQHETSQQPQLLPISEALISFR